MNWDWQDRLPGSGGWSLPPARRAMRWRPGWTPAAKVKLRTPSAFRVAVRWLDERVPPSNDSAPIGCPANLGKAELQSNLIVWLKTDQRRKAAFGSRGQPATVGKRDHCDRPIAGLAELLWIDLCRLRGRERNGKERDAGKNCQPGNQRGEFHAGSLAQLRYLMLDRHFENRIKQIENPIASDGSPPTPVSRKKITRRIPPLPKRPLFRATDNKTEILLALFARRQRPVRRRSLNCFTL